MNFLDMINDLDAAIEAKKVELQWKQDHPIGPAVNSIFISILFEKSKIIVNFEFSFSTTQSACSRRRSHTCALVCASFGTFGRARTSTHRIGVFV